MHPVPKIILSAVVLCYYNISTVYYQQLRVITRVNVYGLITEKVRLHLANRPGVFIISVDVLSIFFRRRLTLHFFKNRLVSVSRLQMKHWRYELTGWRRSVGYQEVVSTKIKNKYLLCAITLKKYISSLGTRIRRRRRPESCNTFSPREMPVYATYYYNYHRLIDFFRRCHRADELGRVIMVIVVTCSMRTT